MTDYFKNIPEIKYEGENSSNPLAFKFYDEDKVVLGKTMKEHLRFELVTGIHLLGQVLIHLEVKHLIDLGCKQVTK
tara:strand:+ start:442 stop:669 length:228 start_codon:yes stop_codon:yes gene_type:complete